MTDPHEFLHDAAPEPRGDVTVEELARRSRRRRRGRAQISGVTLVAVLVVVGGVVFSTRDGARHDRVATEQPPVSRSTSTSSPRPSGPEELWTVDMVSSTTAFAGGPSNIIRSDDGGHHWRAQPITCTSCPGSLYVAGFDMLDSSTGWAATSMGLFRTTDGENWIQQPTAQQYEPSIVQFVSRDEGWILTSPWGAGEFIGQHEAVLSHTIDGGDTWTHVTSVPADVQSICFASATDAWLATRRQVFRSVDAGASWQLSLEAPVNPPPDGGTASVRCAAGGTAVAEFGQTTTDASKISWVVYSTMDAGQNWLRLIASGPEVQPDVGAPFTVIDAQTAFVVRYSLSEGHVDGTFVTNGRDVGPALTITNSAAQFTPVAASFGDRTHGVVVGYAGSTHPFIYFTTDGGATWTPASATGDSPITPAIEDPVPVLQRTVTGVDPIVVPTAVPSDWYVHTVAEANSFSVSWIGPHGEKLVLSVVVPNPPPVGPEGHESSPNFRGDAASVYFDYGQTNPAARERILLWTEPGHWAVEQRGGVPYELSSQGIDEATFLAIADSLQRVGP